MDRPVGSEGAGGGGGRNVRDVRRDSCNGRKSNGLHGPGGLFGMGLEIGRGASHCERARLSGAAGQFHGNSSISLVSSGGFGTYDSVGRSTAADLAVWQNGA